MGTIYPRSIALARFGRSLWARLRALWSAIGQGQLVFSGLLAFLLGRGALAPGIYPLGVAFFIVVARQYSPVQNLLILLLVRSGMATRLSVAHSNYWATAAILFLVALHAYPERTSRRGYNLLFVGIAIFLALPFLVFSPHLVPDLLIWLPTLLGIWAASNLLFPLLEFKARHHVALLSYNQIVAISLLAMGILLGLADIYVGDIHLLEGAGLVLLMAVAHIGGAAAAVMGGLLLGFFMALLGGSLFEMEIYGLFGLAMGIGAGHKKLGIVFGLVVANLATAFFVRSPSELYALWTLSATAVIVFALFPSRLLVRFARIIPRTQAQRRHQELTNRRMKEMLNQRLDDFARVFEELSSTFNQIPTRPVTADCAYDQFLMSLAKKACIQCPGFRACWEDRFHQTYWDMVELLAIAEKSPRIQSTDLPPDIVKYCMQPYQLTTSINVVVEMLRIESAWQRRLQESQEIVTNQLGGLSQIMRSFATQIEMEVEFDEEWELKLKAALLRRNIKPESLRVLRTTVDKPEIHIRMDHGGDILTCQEHVAAIISRALGQEYSVWANEADDTLSGYRCQFVLLPERSFNVQVEALKVAKDGSFISGDTHSQVWLKNGKLAIVISDGMGHGPRAALESTATIAMLKQLMQAGFDREFAVRTVNSVLLLRSTDEVFATVDLVIADLYTGELEFIKVGSPPSFLIRRTGIEVIKANTLPIGILNHVEMEAQIRIWRHGDVLLMITDGILDGYAGLSENWLQRIVRRVPSGDLKAMVNAVMEEAKIANNGQARDDMTVVAMVMNKRTTAGVDVVNVPDNSTPEIPVYDRQLA